MTATSARRSLGKPGGQVVSFATETIVMMHGQN
jgi:hypothetical protein